MIAKAFKRFYDNFLSLKGSPHHIALSYAVGTAIGFSPFIGTHSILSVTISLAFRLNLAAVYLATWLPCNPITAVPMILAEYKIGRILLALPSVAMPKVWTLKVLFSMGWNFFAAVLIGWAVIASATAAPVYFLIRFIIDKVRRTRPSPDDGNQDA